MSIRHPIIAITGSSGVSASSVKKTFEVIFKRECLAAAYIEGDAFHRHDRLAMREELARAARAGNNHDSQFGDYANLLEGLKQNFADHAATGSGRTRHYVDDAQEAIDLAAHLGLGRLIVLWDDNEITIDGATRLSTSTDMKARFAARGWRTQSIDGHDAEQIVAAISAAKADPRPSLIACRTVIGKGALTLAGSEKTHGAPPGGDEIAAARALAN